MSSRKSQSIKSNDSNIVKQDLEGNVFPSRLGWMAIAGQKKLLVGLTFGHRSRRAALDALQKSLGKTITPSEWFETLAKRLQDFAAGKRDEFQDIEVSYEEIGLFQRSVLECCRHIPYGKTVTYRELAEQAGSERAARAVGNCMAQNRIPLIIPCHRVVRSDGVVGCYSAPGGSATKQRLLRLESSN